MSDALERLLASVRNPIRYLGGEPNASRKDPSSAEVTCALCYPDLYEVGMSSLGLRILYGRLNELPQVVCERFFAPEDDCEELLRRQGIPLFTLESRLPVRSFDIVGFSLSSELNFTNFLNLLDLSGIPVRASERTQKDPIVVLGGSCLFNPVPLEPFADLCVVGEGEEPLAEIAVRLSEVKGRPRGEVVSALGEIDGVYAPANGRRQVSKRFVKDLDEAFFPVRWMTPLTEIVHDRISLEIMRGCGQGCRFCQALRCWKPVRHRSAERVIHLAREAYRSSGCSEISLLSFSSGDHPEIGRIVEGLVAEFRELRVALSFPSLRIDTFSFSLANRMREIRKTGLTFAPESSERMRRSLGKEISDGELVRLAGEAKRAGWRQIKLYFMVGLPGETEDDLDGIVRLVREVSGVISVKASFNTFVPRPHTPLERERFITAEEYEDKRAYLRSRLRSRYIEVKEHPWTMSAVEAFLSRGDEKAGSALMRVWKAGGRFENWTEQFSFERWREALAEEGIGFDQLSSGPRGELPWKFVRV